MYLVGGYVRDLFLNKKSYDMDIAVESSFDEMLALVEKYGQIILKKKEFGTIKSRINGQIYDFSICRSEGEYKDHRRPDSIKEANVYSDLARRDFTFNAMALPIKFIDGKQYYNVEEIIDPFDGSKDLSNGIIRCVNDTTKRMTEDPLRLLRAFRFSITLDFNLHDDIIKCLEDKQMISNLKYVSNERIVEELTKCFKCNTLKTLKLLEQFNQLRDYVFVNNDNLWLRPTLEKIKYEIKN